MQIRPARPQDAAAIAEIYVRSWQRAFAGISRRPISTRWSARRALLRMPDGEPVSSMVAVLPETFAALPSTLPRKQQLCLVHRVRSAERDTGLWGRDDKAECGPQRCGYIPDTDRPEARSE